MRMKRKVLPYFVLSLVVQCNSLVAKELISSEEQQKLKKHIIKKSTE